MEQELFELVHEIGETIQGPIHIELQDMENPEDIRYRIYHSKGYCFDIERFQCIASDGTILASETGDPYEYLYFCEHEGFKKIKPARAIELINKTFQLTL